MAFGQHPKRVVGGGAFRAVIQCYKNLTEASIFPVTHLNPLKNGCSKSLPGYPEPDGGIIAARPEDGTQLQPRLGLKCRALQPKGSKVPKHGYVGFLYKES